MKKLICLSVLLAVLFFIKANAQSGSNMLIYKGGKIINTIPLSDFDSLAFTPCYSNCGKVKDYDGNIYSTVIIGTQCWMQSNLNTTHYRNGDSIPNVKNDNAWDNLTTGAYCNYDNNDSIANIYGRMYNWYAVADPNLLCPTGWHVPSDSEWTVLVKYLGDSTIAGGKMMEAGSSHWQSPNIGPTNSSGFTALPGGYRDEFSYNFEFLYVDCGMWSNTVKDITNVWCISLASGEISIGIGWSDKQTGFSIRCIKDK